MLNRVFASFLSVLSLLLMHPSFACNEAMLGEFLASIKSLEANFVQHNPDGTHSTGRIFLSVPSRFRIDYKEDRIAIMMNKGMLTYHDFSLNESRKFFVGKSDPILLVMSNFRNPTRYRCSEEDNLLYLESSTNNKKYVLILNKSPPEVKEIFLENDSGQITRMLLHDVSYNVLFNKSIFTGTA